MVKNLLVRILLGATVHVLQNVSNQNWEEKSELDQVTQYFY
jgi:hypothetical protein